MDSNCRKLGETPYRECRKQAAIYNDALGSMERAAEMLGVSVNTLSNYELGVTVPPVDIAAVTAYATECKRNRTDEKYIKHASTFFSETTPFVDYLKKKDETVKPERTDESNPFR